MRLSKLMGSLALFVVVALSSCSSKKYDSWSDCMSEEINKNNNTPAAEAYCDANYDMTEREKNARQAWYCGANKYEPECNPTAPQLDTSTSEDADGGALSGKPVPFDKLPEELRGSDQPGPWSKYQGEGADPDASLHEAQDAAKASADAAKEAAGN